MEFSDGFYIRYFPVENVINFSVDTLFDAKFFDFPYIFLKRKKELLKNGKTPIKIPIPSSRTPKIFILFINDNKLLASLMIVFRIR